MRIAAISDIHGDFRPLTTVWSDIEARGLADGPVLNAGDTIAYGSSTMECVDFVRDPRRKIVSVSGNYDVNSARFPEREENYRRKWGKLRPDKLAALRDASREMTPAAREWLLAIPAASCIELGGARISLSHYAPTTDKEGLFADTSESRLCQIAHELGGSFDVVVVGHTHSAFCRRAGDVLFVNPGSVGRSYGSPTYAEIVLEPGTLPTARIILCRVSQP